MRAGCEGPTTLHWKACTGRQLLIMYRAVQRLLSRVRKITFTRKNKAVGLTAVYFLKTQMAM